MGSNGWGLVRRLDAQTGTQTPLKGLVYVLECQNFYKIGYTNDSIKSRIADLQVGNPFRIETH